MDLNGTSTNKAFQLEINQFPWKIDDLHLTFMEKMLCLSTAETMVMWIIFSIEFFVMSLAFYGLFYMIKPNQTAPIFVINLFISDVIQICVRPFVSFCTLSLVIVLLCYMYSFSIIVNIGFMVCISMERYVMIKYPVWYRLHNTSKNLVLMCLLVWLLPCGCTVFDMIIVFKGKVEHLFIVTVFLFLLPYPLVVFSFVGSWRALSRSVAVTPDEQKRILRILALVLFNYTVLFMPSIVQSIILSLSFEDGQSSPYDYLHRVAGFLVSLNPLADSLLYVFLRKDANNLLKCLCCERQSENQTQTANSSNSLFRRSEEQISVQTYRENAVI